MASKLQIRREDEARELSIEEEINELDQKLERLRILYEQYFVGVEKLEPTILRRDVERTIRRLQQVQIHNTGLRFRFQNQMQRIQVFAVHWGRVLRQIEAGTWKRARSRAAILEENMPPAMRMARRRRERRLAAIADRRGGPDGDDMPSVDVDGLEEEELPPLPIVDAHTSGWGAGSPIPAPPPRAPVAVGAKPAAGTTAAPPATVSPAAKLAPRPRAAVSLADLPVAKPAAGSPGITPASSPVTQPPAGSPVVRPPAARPPAGSPPAPPTKPAAAASGTSAKPQLPASRPPPVPPPARPSVPPSVLAAPARPYESLFHDFVAARRKAGQGGDVAYESLAKTLAAQERSLRAEKKWTDVRFRVALENGKVVVKASRGDKDS